MSNSGQMQAVAWNNGTHHRSGAGYGIKIEADDRDLHFDPKVNKVLISLDDGSEPFYVNTAKKSFWSPNCRELIRYRIGLWLIENRLAPWSKGDPPKLLLEKLSDGHFKLSRMKA